MNLSGTFRIDVNINMDFANNLVGCWWIFDLGLQNKFEPKIQKKPGGQSGHSSIWVQMQIDFQLGFTLNINVNDGQNKFEIHV